MVNSVWLFIYVFFAIFINAGVRRRFADAEGSIAIDNRSDPNHIVSSSFGAVELPGKRSQDMSAGVIIEGPSKCRIASLSKVGGETTFGVCDHDSVITHTASGPAVREKGYYSIGWALYVWQVAVYR